jgi:hypothetical protein
MSNFSDILAVNGCALSVDSFINKQPLVLGIDNASVY